MCLETIEKFTPCRFGYKIMGYKRRKLYGDICASDKNRPQGKWLNEKDFRQYGDEKRREILAPRNRGSYLIGWHIFNKKVDALKWMSNRIPEVLVRVQVREPVATGCHYSGSRITVAKQIKITEILKYSEAVKV